jgi:hypothetical protein
MATVSCTCHEWMPAFDELLEHLGHLVQRRAAELRVGRDVDPRGLEVGLMASNAAFHEPFTPRRASWVDSSPSTLTLTVPDARLLGGLARSGVSPRPPVVIVHSMPWSRTARAMSVQSSRR